MPRYKVKAFDGKTLTVDADDESGLDAAMQDYEAQNSGGQTHAAPVPEDTANAALDTATKVGQGAALVGGVGAPLAAIAAGAPALPVLGGLAGGVAAGAAADWLLRETGATPFLEEKSRELRKGLPEPKMGGDYGVPLNFLANLGIEATHPKAQAANVLEALPMLASTYAGMKGGQLGSTAAPMLRDNALVNKLIGSPKVPVGQEGAAYVNTLAEKFGTKPVPSGPMEMGGVKQALRGGRAQLGAEKGAVEEAAFANASQPKDAPGIVKQAVADALKRQGVRPGKEALASNEPAAAALQDVTANKAPLVESVADLSDLQRQLAQKGAIARKPTSLTSEEAPYYEGAAQNIKGAVNELLPENLRGPLAEANKAFSQYVELQKLGVRSKNKAGFDASKAISQWQEMEPAQRIKFGKEFEALMDQSSPGVLGRLVEAGRQAGDLKPGSAVKALFKTPPPRFNAPPAKIDPSLARRMGLSAGATGLAAAMAAGENR